ncbi:hypothetical protein SK128_002398 [Halocaridina rubra]|uniref:Uncharacterized protein n=1 Tax=Halocaridina rubra TaxID=373956 RepID=A0AAN8WUV5_HALRR
MSGLGHVVAHINILTILIYLFRYRCKAHGNNKRCSRKSSTFMSTSRSTEIPSSVLSPHVTAFYKPHVTTDTPFLSVTYTLDYVHGLQSENEVKLSDSILQAPLDVSGESPDLVIATKDVDSVTDAPQISALTYVSASTINEYAITTQMPNQVDNPDTDDPELTVIPNLNDQTYQNGSDDFEEKSEINTLNADNTNLISEKKYTRNRKNYRKRHKQVRKKYINQRKYKKRKSPSSGKNKRTPFKKKIPKRHRHRFSHKKSRRRDVCGNGCWPNISQVHNGIKEEVQRRHQRRFNKKNRRRAANARYKQSDIMQVQRQSKQWNSKYHPQNITFRPENIKIVPVQYMVNSTRSLYSTLSPPPFSSTSSLFFGETSPMTRSPKLSMNNLYKLHGMQQTGSELNESEEESHASEDTQRPSSENKTSVHRISDHSIKVKHTLYMERFLEAEPRNSYPVNYADWGIGPLRSP